MTDYRETGLPQDPTVFRAFKTYEKNAKDAAAELGLSEDFPVRVAQAINTTMAADSTLLSAALLSVVPRPSWDIIEKNFGKATTALMEEADLHNRTGYAYIDQASEPVKAIALASAIAAFSEFKTISEGIEQAVTKVISGQAPMESLQQKMMMMPNVEVYAHLQKALSDKSGSPALEALFQERFDAFREAREAHNEKLAEMGIVFTMPGQPMPGMASAELRFPAFEDTGLLDDAKVRAVYEVITNHPRVQPDDFEGALAAAKMLSELPASKNPTAIAGALLDVGLRSLGPDDHQFLKTKIDWDVLELLSAHSVRDPLTPAALKAAPEEFQQIVIANATAALGHAKEGIKGALESLDQQDFAMPEEMTMPPELKMMMKMQALQQLDMLAAMSRHMIGPVLGHTAAPELEKAYEQSLKDAQQFIRDNAPKQQKLLPPPPRKKPGNDFTFD
ncbi:MAG: hypothetical protein ACAH80_06225 [Alphaproteobacteria bacterium]